MVRLSGEPKPETSLTVSPAALFEIVKDNQAVFNTCAGFSDTDPESLSVIEGRRGRVRDRDRHLVIAHIAGLRRELQGSSTIAVVGECSEGRCASIDKGQDIGSIQVSGGDRNGEGIILIDIVVADQAKDRRMVDRADSNGGVIGIEDWSVERVEPLNGSNVGGGLVEDSRFDDNEMFTREENGAAADCAIDRVIILLDIRGGECVVINRDQVVSTEPVAGTAIGD